LFIEFELAQDSSCVDVPDLGMRTSHRECAAAMFGAITIDGVDEAAVGIEATYGGTTAVVLIQRE